MGKYFELTDEIMQNAVVYMSIENKETLAKEIAQRCVVDTPTAEQNQQGEKLLALPYIKVEDREIKTLCLMKVLLSCYLLVLNEEVVLTQEKYNYYAEGSILNQIERYKSNYELKNKAFDLLADFKEFRKFVDVEINNLITVNNDPLARFIASIQALSTPENIKKAIEELQKSGKNYTEFLQEKKIIPKIDNPAKKPITTQGQKSKTKEKNSVEKVNNG